MYYNYSCGFIELCYEYQTVGKVTKICGLSCDVTLTNCVFRIIQEEL